MKRFIISKLAIAFAAVFLASSFASFTGTAYAAETDAQKIDWIRQNCKAVPDSKFKDNCERRQNELKAKYGDVCDLLFESYDVTSGGDNATTKLKYWKFKPAVVDACQDKVEGKQQGETAAATKDNALRNGERLMNEFTTKCVPKYSDNNERCDLIIETMLPVCTTKPASKYNEGQLKDYVDKCKEAIKAGGSAINEDNETVDCDMKLASPLSWIACPIIDMGVGFTDFVFEDFVQPMLEQVPVSTNPEDGVYKAWAQFRFIANLLLIASLLAIVYSQAKGAK